MRLTVALAVLGTLAGTAMGQQRALFDRARVQHHANLSSAGFEAKPDISNDRLTLYFASDNGNAAFDLDIFVATRPTLNDPFGAPTSIAVLNFLGERDHTPTTSADGRFMIFSSSRPGGLGSDDAWMSTRKKRTDPWGAPVHIPELSTVARDMGFSMTADGLKVYLSSNRITGLDFDLFESSRPDRNSPWSIPTPIVELNTPVEDKFPSVTADDKVLFFASERPGSVPKANGQASQDIWVAMRPDTSSPWTVIENAHEINTPDGEYLMSIADDGQEIFFVSDRPGTLGGFDLYSAPVVPGVLRYGVGITGSAGVPQVLPTGGAPSVGNANFGYEVSMVHPPTTGFWYRSLAPSNAPLQVAQIGWSAQIFQLPSSNNPPPSVARFVPDPIADDPALIGMSLYNQAVIFGDPQGSFLIRRFVAASPGIERVILP